MSDCRHPNFRNLNSTVSVDVVRVKSYVDSFLNFAGIIHSRKKLILFTKTLTGTLVKLRRLSQ